MHSNREYPIPCFTGCAEDMHMHKRDYMANIKNKRIKEFWCHIHEDVSSASVQKSQNCPSSSSGALPYLSAWRTTWWIWSCEHSLSSETTSRQLPSPFIHNTLSRTAFALLFHICAHCQTRKISSPFLAGPVAILSINASLPECLRHSASAGIMGKDLTNQKT